MVQPAQPGRHRRRRGCSWAGPVGRLAGPAAARAPLPATGADRLAPGLRAGRAAGLAAAAAAFSNPEGAAAAASSGCELASWTGTSFPSGASRLMLEALSSAKNRNASQIRSGAAAVLTSIVQVK